MDLLLSAENIPFGVALSLLVALVLIETLGMLLSHSFFTWLGELIPDHLDGPLGWLHIGKVPILVSLILFLLGFSCSGYILQMAIYSVFNSFGPMLPVSALALLGGLILMRTLSNFISRIIPRDESSVIDEESLTGRIGVVTLGVAKQDLAAQVRVIDHQGRSYYLMVLPENAEEEFPEGTAVIIVRKAGATYRAIKHPHPELI